MSALLRRPGLVVAGAVLLLLAAATGIPKLRFESDLRSFVGDSLPEARVFFDLQESGAANETLFVTLAARGPEGKAKLTRHARSLADALRARPEVKEVASAPTAEQVMDYRSWAARRLFLLLPPEHLDDALARLTPEGLDAGMAEVRAMVESAAPLATKKLLVLDPFGLREIAEKLDPGTTVKTRGGFLLSADEDAVLLRVAGIAPLTEQDLAVEFLAAVREEAGRLPADEVEVDLAGGHLFAEETEKTVRADLVKTIIPSLVAVALLFWVFFRTAAPFLVAAVPVVLALAVTLGGLGWLGVEITPLAAAFCALIVGLGVDFGIHLLVSFDVERAGGADRREAALAAVRGVGRGILLGGTTTALALATLAFSGLPALTVLGVSLSIGVVTAMLATLIVSPALLAILPSKRTGLAGRPFAALGAALGRRRTTVRWVSIAVVGGCVGLLAIFGPPELHTDPEKLRPEGDPATAALRRLLTRFDWLGYPDLAVFRGEDPGEGLVALEETRAALERSGALDGWDGPDRIIPPVARQGQSLERLRQFDAAGFPERARDAMVRHGLNPEPFEPAIEEVAEALSPSGPIGGEALLDPAVAPLAQRYLAGSGEDRMLFAYFRPTGGVDDVPMGAGVIHTGPRVILTKVEGEIRGRAWILSTLVLGSLFAIILLGFRRPGPALVSMVPVLLGTLATLAVMRLCGVSFNLVNIGVVPMLLGLGVDDGIQFVNRRLGAGGGGLENTYRHVGGAVLLTTLTTCAAFGSLAFAKSPGIASMGVLTALGSLSACAATLLVLPGFVRDRSEGRP